VRGRSRGQQEVVEIDDEARFAALYERCYPEIRAYCSRRTGRDRVDDAVAETFLVAWRRIDDVPPGREGLLWLYRVAYLVVGHEWRSEHRRRRLGTRLQSVRPTASSSPEDRAVDAEQRRQVLEAIRHLKPADTELLLLVAWEQLSAADLATVLDVNPNTVSQRLSRARKQLAREFGRFDSVLVRSPAAPKGGVR
jgi:RNA polymerase sigma-70 factor (ECF subfamily)